MYTLEVLPTHYGRRPRAGRKEAHINDLLELRKYAPEGLTCIEAGTGMLAHAIDAVQIKHSNN